LLTVGEAKATSLQVMKINCPICKQVVEPLDTNKTFPFCSPRCRSIDLGNWFSDEYVSSRPVNPDTDGEALLNAVNKEEFN
jgi:endogenous inhibitor of DNA gyrase (YacG/DUF329 family)